MYTIGVHTFILYVLSAHYCIPHIYTIGMSNVMHISEATVTRLLFDPNVSTFPYKDTHQCCCARDIPFVTKIDLSYPSYQMQCWSVGLLSVGWCIQSNIVKIDLLYPLYRMQW